MTKPRKKTLVFRVEMDPPTEEVIDRFAREMAKWEQKAFGRWYEDFRQHRADLSKARYAGLLTPELKKDHATGQFHDIGKFRVNVQGSGKNLYNLFITKKARVEPAVQTYIRPTVLQGVMSHLGTGIGNFLNIGQRGQRCHDRRIIRRQKEANARRYGKARKFKEPNNFYPKFDPIARFQHNTVSWEFIEGGGTITVDHPFTTKTKLTIRIVPSKDERFAARLGLVHDLLNRGSHAGIELVRRTDGTRRNGWYCHVAVSIPDAPVAENVTRVAGVDVGERNPASVAVVSAPGHMTVAPPKMYSGISTRDRLERETNRVRRLRRVKARGVAGAGRALARAKGKQARILDTMIHQVSYDVVKYAHQAGADAVAMEDLSKFTPGRKVRQKKMPFHGKRAKHLRRLLSRWNRGQLQDAIRYKATAQGLRIAGPQGAGIYARGTSSTCPKCGVKDDTARNRSIHTFLCRQPGCGYVGNDDLTGSVNIANRGWNYFHSSKYSNPPSEPGNGNKRGDSLGASALGEGAPSVSQATLGVQAGTDSLTTKKAENGAGAAVVSKGANHPSPTVGVAGGSVEPTTSHSDTARDTLIAKGAASGQEVTPHPAAARKPFSRRRVTTKPLAYSAVADGEDGGSRK